MDSANIPANQQSNKDELYDQGAKRPFKSHGGEDEASVTDEGSDGAPTDDAEPLHATPQAGGPQKDKGLSSQTDGDQASQVDTDDPHKTEKLVEAGRDIETNDGAD